MSQIDPFLSHSASSGVVFLYHGSKEDGLESTPSQVLRGDMADVSTTSSTPSSTTSFGFSLVGGKDFDGNGFPDLIVGDILADSAFIFWVAPPAKISHTRLIVNQDKAVDLTQPAAEDCTGARGGGGGGGGGAGTSVSASKSMSPMSPIISPSR